MSKYLPNKDRSGLALCLSGGGFRASLFHAGALRRLNELGLLARVDTVTSVSGGSIVNGLLAAMFIQKAMVGAYWGIGSDHKDFGLAGSQGFDPAEVELLGGIRTDLDAFTKAEVACLENHGYAIADTAVRRWLPEHLPLKDAPFAWPHVGFTRDDPAAIAVALKDSGKRGILSDVLRLATERLRI